MDTITLYYGFRESLSSDMPLLTTTKVSKIENIRKISKGISLSQYTNPEKQVNPINNFYALVSDELIICPLGMLIINKNKKQHDIYVGQKVFATTKEDLCEYYRIQAKKKIEKLEEVLECTKGLLKSALERTLENTARNDCSIRFYNSKINRFMEYIAKTKQQYKEIVEKIKKL